MYENIDRSIDSDVITSIFCRAVEIDMFFNDEKHKLSNNIEKEKASLLFSHAPVEGASACSFT